MYSLEERKLWSKQAKMALVARELSTKDLATITNYTPQYVSMIINGNYYSKEAVKKISDTLGIRSY